MTGENDAAVSAFLSESETVFREYDRGYIDADVALTRLRRHIDDLESEREG